MNIDINNQKEFIIRNVLFIYNKVTITKQQYTTALARKETKKTVLTYQQTIDQVLLILTFTFILIAIPFSICKI